MEDYIDEEAVAKLSEMDELDYQTHIVIRVFEVRPPGREKKKQNEHRKFRGKR